MADVQWTGWSTIKDLTFVRNEGPVLATTPENFDDVWRVSVGANYRMNDRWMLRGGLAYDESPVNDDDRTPRLPDADRTWLSFGAQYKYSDKLIIDGGVTYIFVKDATINTERRQHGAVRPAARQLRLERLDRLDAGGAAVLAERVAYFARPGPPGRAFFRRSDHANEASSPDHRASPRSPAAAAAAEVGGVKLDDKASVGGKELVLNGAGVRTRAIFKVYVGSLYLPAKATTPRGRARDRAAPRPAQPAAQPVRRPARRRAGRRAQGQHQRGRARRDQAADRPDGDDHEVVRRRQGEATSSRSTSSTARRGSR